MTSGSLTISGQARVFGALSIGHAMIPGTPDGDRVELWYNHELQQGLVRGMPLVYLVPGSFRELR